MEKVEGVKSPRVGLVNNGAEAEKGTPLTKEAYKRIGEMPVNFRGNAEGRDLVSGEYDVLVCDGFTGNVILKFMEGLGNALFSMLKQELGVPVLVDNDVYGPFHPLCVAQPDDCGEAHHLQSVSNSVVRDNLVRDNVGGILLTDEDGPTYGNLIADKGVCELVQAILSRSDRCLGVFVGDGPEKDFGNEDGVQSLKPLDFI
jgi:hypothetical protein